MRKKRFNSEKKFTLLRNSFIIAFILVCVFIGTGYSLLTTQIEIEGKATMLSNEKKEDNTELSNSTANITLDTTYKNNVMITIKNQDEDSRNWNIEFDISEVPSSIVAYESENNLSITTSGNTIKVKETGNDLMSDWNINTEKTIHFQMEFQSDVTKFSISNLYFNGRKINNFISNTNSTGEYKPSNKVTFKLVDNKTSKEENGNSISNNVSNQNTMQNNSVNYTENKIQNAENVLYNTDENVAIENKMNDVSEKSTNNAVNNVLKNTIVNNITDNTNKTKENAVKQEAINADDIINAKTE